MNLESLNHHRVMTTFTFRLQPLMKLREAERDRCREELADAYRAEQILNDRQQAIHQEIEETQQVSRQKSGPGRIEVDGLLNTHRYELMLTAQLQQIATQRKKVEEEIERRRHALIKADQDLRMLEKLRERHASNFRFREEKLQMAQMDELALRLQRTTRGGNRS